MDKAKPKTVVYGPVFNPKNAHGYRHVRWVENVSLGLRLVGFADEIARKEHSRAVEHKGWFIRDDDYGGEVFRGVVYQLPTRDGGTPRFVYGYADPFNDDCALLCFDFECEKLEAARSADRFAERFAEVEREYSRAYDARQRFNDLTEEQKTMRAEALQLAAEMKRAKRANVEAPTICATLRAKIFGLREQIEKARLTQARLFADFGREAGWEG